MNMENIPQLEEYNISEKFGFLNEGSLESLPKYFARWQQIAKNIAMLLQDKSLRKEVNQMPLLDHTRLHGFKEYSLAYCYLAFMTSGYIWQEGVLKTLEYLPKQLSIPLCGVSQYLGIKPGLTYYAFLLANWRLLDPKGPLVSENMDIPVAIPDVDNFKWLGTVSAECEIAAAPGIKAIIEAMGAVVRTDDKQLLSSLTSMMASLEDMKRRLSRIHEKMNAQVFFNVVLSYLNGWGYEGSVYPEGLVYEGVPDAPKEVFAANAGATSIVQCFDKALGIVHDPDKEARLEGLRAHMPRCHRTFILDLEKGPSIKEYVKRNNTNLLLVEAFENCVKTVKDFRTYHVQVFTKFVMIPSKKAKQDKENDELKDPIMPFLKGLRDSTAVQL